MVDNDLQIIVEVKSATPKCEPTTPIMDNLCHDSCLFSVHRPPEFSTDTEGSSARTPHDCAVGAAAVHDCEALVLATQLVDGVLDVIEEWTAGRGLVQDITSVVGLEEWD